MYKSYISNFLLIISMLVSCNSTLAENESAEWIGWYGEAEGEQAWLNVYIEDNAFYCKVVRNGETNVFSAELIEDLTKVNLNLPLHLEKGKPFIKAALKTENFYLFKVEKSSILDFTTEYFSFVPIPQVGGAMKKMKAPAN